MPASCGVTARQVYVDAGLLMTAATFAQVGAEIAFRAGDLHGEEAVLRDSLEILEGIGERGFYSTQALCARGVPLPRRSGGHGDRGVVREGARDDRRRRSHQLRLAGHGRRVAPRTARRVRAGGAVLTSSGRAGRNRGLPLCTRRSPVCTSPRSWRCPVGREEAAEVAAEAFEIFEAKGDVAGCAQFRSRLSVARRRGRLIVVAERYQCTISSDGGRTASCGSRGSGERGVVDATSEPARDGP